MKGLKFTKDLDELKPTDREYYVWSQDLPGFGMLSYKLTVVWLLHSHKLTVGVPTN